ncbi:MAG: protein kinase domain-containing protein [Pyrinomonadaceae bacterium]
MTLCHDCGSETAENALVCPQCGTSLDALPIGSEGEVSPLSSKNKIADSLEPVSSDMPQTTERVTRVEGETPYHPDQVEPSGDLKADDPSTNGGETSHSIGSDTDGKRPGLKTLAVGTVLNARYEIVRKIGGGGMGAVYLSLDKNLGGVERAVKEMVQSSIEEEQQQKAVEDFKRESMILSTLDHPSIPTIYDYFFDEQECRFYLVMKYISGGDLAARLRAAAGGRIDEKTVTEWAVQVTDVLAYLHGLPTTIVYRDLKPSNLMLDGATGRIMLIDFGIARSINQAQEKGVTAVGTMGYAPPELFSGNVEPRSDIYSLGSTMFHLLTGADPQNNPLLIFDFQKNPRPRQINPQLSDQIESILMRAVEYNVESRFSSSAEMRQVLSDHLENLKRGNITYGISAIPAAVSLANQIVFCGFCGQRIVASDMFCAFCGAKQPIAQQGVHSEIYSNRSSTAKLVIDGTGELDPPAFSLEKSDNLLGRRDPTANIFPDVDLSRFDPDTKISRRHARIWRDGEKFLVEDLGSSNGTVLLVREQEWARSETHRLQPHQPHVLTNGDVLRVGDTTLSFRVN